MTKKRRTPSALGKPEIRSVTLEVKPRRPRLAWQGMDQREAAASVQAQVLEIVRPRRASDAAPTDAPQSRLIWAKDNLLALETLLEERDPATGDHRYRGKVDLVYIDPPFMVQGDFRADSAIEIDLDDEARVEIIAYKDTWRQGLDSFLSMLRARLTRLAELLSPAGSIYVHLDWHAVHYVKVLMDEIFGAERFVNEIIWRRYGAHNDAAQGSRHYGRVHDTILVYSMGEGAWEQLFTPLSAEYVRSTYRHVDEETGKRFTTTPLTGPGGAENGNPIYEWKGHTRAWRYSRETMERLEREGRLHYSSSGYVRQKLYLDESSGVPVQDTWIDTSSLSGQHAERLRYPTQKPVALLERVIRASCPPGGLVLDCFLGSGTTAEAAERLGRRWIGIDNAKHAIHLARRRLIQLDGQPMPPAIAQADYVECGACNNIERRERPQRSPGPFRVRPFTVEAMGVYERAEPPQRAKALSSRYRDELIRVFGGEPMAGHARLHGRKGDAWIHVGPLDGAVAPFDIGSIAREARRVDPGCKAVTILSVDADALPARERDNLKEVTGVMVTMRVVPASAMDEVRRRLERARGGGGGDQREREPVEPTAIPAFYAPLSLEISAEVKGRAARVRLERCDIDIESLFASQRPRTPTAPGQSGARGGAARERAKAGLLAWEERKRELATWLDKPTSWQKLVDLWAVDWDYGRSSGADGEPVFESEWQSLRIRKAKGEASPLHLVAEHQYQTPGQRRVAARVTDVFGNDGIATATVDVRS